MYTAYVKILSYKKCTLQCMSLAYPYCCGYIKNVFFNSTMVQPNPLQSRVLAETNYSSDYYSEPKRNHGIHFIKFFFSTVQRIKKQIKSHYRHSAWLLFKSINIFLPGEHHPRPGVLFNTRPESYLLNLNRYIYEPEIRTYRGDYENTLYRK